MNVAGQYGGAVWRSVGRVLPKGSLGRHVALLAGGTAGGQVLTVLFSPVLTRLYGPREFGVFGMFSGAVLVLNSINSLRYEIAIPLPKEEEDAEQLLALCCVLLCVTGLLLFFSLHFWGSSLCRALGVGALAPYVWLLPANMVAAGLTEAFIYYTVRKQAFKAAAQARFAQSIGQNVAQFAFGLTGFGALGLLMGDTVSRAVAAIALFRAAGLGRHLKAFKVTQIKERAAEYGRFPRLNAPATLLNIAALQLPFLLVPFFFGMEAAGSYFLAYRVLILPTALVGSAVGSVFFSKAAATEKEGAGTDVITGRVALGLIAVYLPIYLALALAGGPVFSFVFGGKWTGAGIYGRILTPAAFSTAIASPLSTVLVVKNRLGKSLTITMSDLLARGVALAVGVHFASLWLTVVLISTFSTVLGCVSLGLFLRWADVRVAPLAKAVGSIVWLNLPLLVVVGLAGIFAPPLLATISAGVMVVISCWLSSAFMKGLATA